MANHTPAPWHDDNYYGNIWHASDDGSETRGVIMGSGDGIAINNPADRDLILATPDMYDALYSAKALMDVRNDYGVVYDEICGALKKARGEV